MAFASCPRGVLYAIGHGEADRGEDVGKQGDGDGRLPPAQVMDLLRNGLVARLMPLMRDALDAALRELDSRASANPPSPSLIEDRTDIGLLLREVLAYEKRWQEQIDAMLRGWPALAGARRGGFELMAESELQVQLVGASVIDALERRFEDVIDLIDRRLYTVAARMGERERPRNPFAPRSLAESFLRAFTVLDSSARVHALVLKHFSRLAAERLGVVYQWCNSVLSEAGYELSSGNEGVLVPGLAPELAQGRGAGTRPDGVAGADQDALDGLRNRLVSLRGPVRAADGARDMRDDELRSVLALLQSEREPAVAGQGSGGTAEGLRLRIERTAAGIGLAPGSVTRSPEQDAAIEVVGRLLDHLHDGAALSPAAAHTLSRMALPCLRSALESPGLFDDPGRPPLMLLATLVELWDGNPGGTPAERLLHRIADEAAGEILADPEGSLRLAAQVLAQIEAQVEPLRRRADMAARRLWQSLQGKERLEAARSDADAQLERLFARGMLPPVLAAFLSEHWRQWLVQIWLREGAGSPRHAAAVELGDSLVAIDSESDGHRLARTLLEAEPALRECIASSGLHGEAAAAALSALIAEFADPDRQRQPVRVEPLASERLTVPEGPVRAVDGLQPGDRVVCRGEDGTMRALQFAWQSPLTGHCLLVDAQGTRQALLAGDALRDALAEGRDMQRRPSDPVRNALAAIEAAIRAAPGG
jgi:hypothetical protein